MNPGQGVIAGVTYTGKQLIAGVVDSGNKHKIANISANFCKNLNQPEWDTQGPGGTDS